MLCCLTQRTYRPIPVLPAKFAVLRWVWVRSVAVSPAAIARLKDDCESAARRLAPGYSQRKP